MRVLFVHRRFPAQYGRLVRALAADAANQVVFVASEGPVDVGWITVRRYRRRRAPAPATHHYLKPFEEAVLDGQAVYRVCAELRREGFVPDVIAAHCGWGVMLYLKEAFPEASLLGYFEWYYRARGADVGFLESGDPGPDEACRIRTLNAPLVMGLVDCDRGITPTDFQRRQIPQPLREKVTVLHDGIDTTLFAPSPSERREIGGVDLGKATRIVTYATRGMEPYRGFPQFMQAAALLLEHDPLLHIVIAGTDTVHYSRRLPGETYKERALAELPRLDRSRLHFVGRLARDDYLRLLRLSDAHVYLTVPFVLSWSLLEAMATGCLVVASDTEPVREVVTEGRNGLLVDLRSPEAIAAVVRKALSLGRDGEELRVAARRTIVSRFALADLLPRHIRLLQSMAGTGAQKISSLMLA